MNGNQPDLCQTPECLLKLFELLAALYMENDTHDHMGFPVLQRWYGAPYYS